MLIKYLAYRKWAENGAINYQVGPPHFTNEKKGKLRTKTHTLPLFHTSLSPNFPNY